MIWDKVALDESVILHRLTQNSRNTVLPDTKCFENLVRMPTTATQSHQIIAVAEFQTVFSNSDLRKHSTIQFSFFYLY